MFHIFKTIRKVKERSDKEFKAAFEKDKKGNSLITVKAENLDKFMSGYQVNDYQIINEDLYTNIEVMVGELPIKENVAIEFNLKNKEDKNKEDFVYSFKHHYILKSITYTKQKKSNFLIAGLCSITSLVLIVIMMVIELAFPDFYNDILPDMAWEILIVLIWVLSWEAFDRFLFYNQELSFNCLNCYRLYNSRISFKKDIKKPIVQTPTQNNTNNKVASPNKPINNQQNIVHKEVEKKQETKSIPTNNKKAN